MFSGYTYTIMRKYLVGLIIVLLLGFVVARQDRRAADQSAQKSTRSHETTNTAAANKQHPQENIGDPGGNGPRWYWLCFGDLFRWPNGTETWAMILTLLAIAEQSNESRKSTKIASEAIIHQFRPRLKVRSIWADDWDHPTKITVTLVNVGGTNAQILRGSASLRRENRYESRESLQEAESAIRGQEIVAGQESDAAVIPLEDGLAWQVMSEGINRDRSSALICYGKVVYRDDNGVERNMGFDRIYDWDSKSFTPREKSEKEYSD
jgi:hypothetical protein